MRSHKPNADHSKVSHALPGIHPMRFLTARFFGMNTCKKLSAFRKHASLNSLELSAIASQNYENFPALSLAVPTLADRATHIPSTINTYTKHRGARGVGGHPVRVQKEVSARLSASPPEIWRTVSMSGAFAVRKLAGAGARVFPTRLRQAGSESVVGGPEALPSETNRHRNAIIPPSP